MLKEIIDRYYLDREKDKDRTHFYITDAGKCPRSVFFKFKNAPKKALDPNILRIFDHGDHIHQLIMRALFGAQDIEVVCSEIDIPPQKIISGRADAIISDRKRHYVLDIKSSNGFAFKGLKEPKPENVYQIQLYLHYFGISKGILLYVNKNNQDLREFVVDYDPNMAKTLLASLEALQRKIKAGLIPARLANYPKDRQCRYCQFREICSIADEGEMKWEEFKKKFESSGD